MFGLQKMKGVQGLFLTGALVVDTLCDLTIFPSDGVPKQGQVAVVSAIINCDSLGISTRQV